MLTYRTTIAWRGRSRTSVGIMVLIDTTHLVYFCLLSLNPCILCLSRLHCLSYFVLLFKHQKVGRCAKLLSDSHDLCKFVITSLYIDIFNIHLIFDLRWSARFILLTLIVRIDMFIIFHLIIFNNHVAVLILWWLRLLNLLFNFLLLIILILLKFWRLKHTRCWLLLLSQICLFTYSFFDFEPSFEQSTFTLVLMPNW